LDEVGIYPITATDQDAIDTIKILNLNTPKLKGLRGKVIAGLIYQDRSEREFIPIQDAQRLLTTYEHYNLDNTRGYLPEFLSAIIYLLRLLSGK